MVIKTYDGQEYFIEDERGERLKQAWTSTSHPEQYDIYGDGRDTITHASISGIHSDRTYNTMQIGSGAPELPAPKNTETRRQWLRILQLNKAKLKKEGGAYKQVAIIRSIEQLNHYDTTGEWPAYEAPNQRQEKTILVSEKKATGWRYSRNKYGEYMTRKQAEEAVAHPLETL